MRSTHMNYLLNNNYSKFNYLILAPSAYSSVLFSLKKLNMVLKLRMQCSKQFRVEEFYFPLKDTVSRTTNPDVYIYQIKVGKISIKL
jgi:hypothetical protein